jgi:predicted negative regulator of RcsB-dependent stress response
MSIKDGIEYAKTELTSDEKMLEGLFKFESFYNKYKKIIWILVALIALFFIGKVAYNYWNDMKIVKSNEALLKLYKNPTDKAQLAILKDNNIALYDLFSYQSAIQKNDINALKALSNSSDELVADMSRYAVGAIDGKPSKSKIYNDMSILEEASNAIAKNDMATAKKILDSMPKDSPAAQIAGLLKHQTLSIPVK